MGIFDAVRRIGNIIVGKGESFITLDFVNVKKISPSFASEAFACFFKLCGTSTDLEESSF